MSDDKNTDQKNSKTKTGGRPNPSKRRSPKRGAFPTPKEEIEKAKPYIPYTKKDGSYPSQPDLPTKDKPGGK